MHDINKQQTKQLV